MGGVGGVRGGEGGGKPPQSTFFNCKRYYMHGRCFVLEAELNVYLCTYRRRAL